MCEQQDNYRSLYTAGNADIINHLATIFMYYIHVKYKFMEKCEELHDRPHN